MTNNRSADTADEKSAWTQPGFIAAAAVVALIALLGIILAFSGDPKGEAQIPAAQPPSSDTGSPSASADPDESACALPAGSQVVPTEAPQTRWELVGQIATPAAPKTIGPARIERGLRSCFAHSPKGALYAAVNVIAMTADPRRREAFIRKLTVPGIGRDRALVELGRSSDAENATTALQVAGFKVTDYRDDSAVVDLAFRVDNGSRAGTVHLPLALRWLDGDWKLALPDTGQPFDGMTRLPSTSGYVPWKGA